MCDKIDMNLLQHEILKTLRETGVSFTKVGSEISGHRAIYYYSPGSGRLQFGLLVGLLNRYERNNPDTKDHPLTVLRINFEDVTIVKYDWTDVAKAIEILAFNGYVQDQPEGSSGAFQDRLIRLNPDGLIAYNTEYYLKLKEKEESERLLLKSNLTTEVAVRDTAEATKDLYTATRNLYRATLAIVIVTLAVGLAPLFKDDGIDKLQQRITTLEQRLQSLQNQQSHPTNVPFPAKAVKDSLGTK